MAFEIRRNAVRPARRPVIADRWGGTTYRDNIVYVHILEWEKDQITFEIPGNTMEKWEVISGGKQN